MNRRRLIRLLGGTTAATLIPLARAGAQSSGKRRRIGFLGNSTAVLEANLIEPFRDGLRALGYEEGRTVDTEYRWADGKPGALLILADRVFLHNRIRLMDFAEKERLPSINAYRELVEAGGLMSFGPSYEDMPRRAAEYVDKILSGAKAGDLPIQLPTKFTLVVNLKTAKALGITIPGTFLLRADQVIE